MRKRRVKFVETDFLQTNKILLFSFNFICICISMHDAWDKISIFHKIIENKITKKNKKNFYYWNLNVEKKGNFYVCLRLRNIDR